MSHVKCEKLENVGRLVLNRPEARNAVSQDMWEAIPKAIDYLQTLQPRIITLSGEGKDFGIGADLDDIVDATENLVTARAYCTTVVHALLAVAWCPVPTLAFIHGAAVGGSVELALAAKVRVAVPRARIYLPFSRLGIVPDRYTSWRLAQLVGDYDARLLIARAAPIGAQEALQLGLVDAIADDMPTALGECGDALTAAARIGVMNTELASASAAELAEPMAQSFINGKVGLAARAARHLAR